MEHQSFCYSVPGSMLLLGEYTIIQPGSRALCVAIDKRAKLHLDIHKTNDTNGTPLASTKGICDYICGEVQLKLTSKYQNKVVVWKHPHDFRMFEISESLFRTDYSSHYLQGNSSYAHLFNSISSSDGASKLPTMYAQIDTNEFFIPASQNDGAKEHILNKQCPSLTSFKLGLGSSEACALLCCVLVLRCHNIDPFLWRQVLLLHAMRTHYVWQGQKGSGYGVCTSLFGGIGTFFNVQGSPRWTPLFNLEKLSTVTRLDLTHLGYWYYLWGGKTVSSPDAIEYFLRWKHHNPQTYFTLEKEIHAHIDAFDALKDITEMHKWLICAKAFGERLGAEIGVSAEVSLPSSLLGLGCSLSWKATGAGNENAILISDKVLPADLIFDNIEGYFVPISIGEGLLCH